MNELATIRPASNVEAYRASTEAADLCREIVVAASSQIQGKSYVSVEGWQAIARAHGCAAGARDVEAVDGGVRAIGEVRDILSGKLISTAEGFVGEDEAVWFGGTITNKWGKTVSHEKRADYAIRAMAQTRAMSRACRSAFAHVVVMMKADLSTTPLEEVPAGGFDRETGEIIDAAPIKQTPAKEAPEAVPMATDSQRDLIQTIASAVNKPIKGICDAYKVKSLKELTEAQAEKVIARLKGMAPATADILDDCVPY